MQKKCEVLYLCIAIFHIHFSFEEQLPKWKLFKENEDLNLTCNVTKSATWYFNGVKISNNKIFEHHSVNSGVSVTHSVLKLQKANKNNAGIYNCVNQQGKSVIKYIVQPNGFFVSFCNYDGPYAVFHDKGFLNISFAIYHKKGKYIYDSSKLSPFNGLCDGQSMHLVLRYLDTKDLNYKFIDGFEVETTRFYIAMNLTKGLNRYHIPCSEISFQVDALENDRCVAKSYRSTHRHSTSTFQINSSTAAHKLSTSTSQIDSTSAGHHNSTRTVPLSYISTENVQKPINKSTIGLAGVKDKASTMATMEVYILVCGILSAIFLASSIVVWWCTRKK